MTTIGTIYHKSRTIEKMILKYRNIKATEYDKKIRKMYDDYKTYGYDYLEKIDFNDCFNTEMIEDMCEMFQNCEKLKEIDLSNFNTKNVTDMSGMFSNCAQITKINASRFDTSKVENMSSYCVIYRT